MERTETCEGFQTTVAVRVEGKMLLYGSLPSQDEPHVTFTQGCVHSAGEETDRKSEQNALA